jgi:hypothetical protein
MVPKLESIFHALFKIKSLFTISNKVAICEFIYEHLKEEKRRKESKTQEHKAKDIETIQDKEEEDNLVASIKK